MKQLSPEARKDNFVEVVKGYTEEQAVKEASRCLECGCHDYYECRLVALANQYDVKPDRLAGEVKKTEFEDNHPFIIRDPNKCILCGLCVRACDALENLSAIGLLGRGFTTEVGAAFRLPLGESICNGCGKCVEVCPTGALYKKAEGKKNVAVDKD